jgi:predicted transcriptional regulator
MYALAGLAACPRDLIDYLCERMDSNNIVFSNAKVRDNFKDIIYKVSGFETVYQDATIKRAFHALVKKNLLIRGDKRGTYIVNPLYYSKNENKERIQLIENLVREDLLKFKS